MPPELHVVTGAFGYTGKYIAQRLLALRKRVKTLTGHPQRPNPFGSAIEVAPFNFDRPAELVRSLRGATILYNTYWIRFPYRDVTFETAVENTKTLIRAAQEAGVEKFVHISITNASADSPFPYFKWKGVLEREIVQSGLPYAIIRPTVIFGPEDILIHNIAWLLRRLPVFAVAGSGDYRLQPVFVEDVAELAVTAARASRSFVIDAVGPEILTFNTLVQLIAGKLRRRVRIVHVRPRLLLLLSLLLGYFVGDVLLTREEIGGLMANLLVSKGPATGQTRLSDWLEKNAASLGRQYASEVQRHYR